MKRFIPKVWMVTLYQLKEHAANVQAELASAKEKLADMLADPASDMEENRKQKQRVADLAERYEGLNTQVTEMEAAAKASMAARGGNGAQMSRPEARGRFYQTAINGGNVRELPQMVYEQLGAIPANDADQGSGSNFLPTNMSQELLMEPLVNNPLRQHMTVTQITGLEIPKLDFALEDDSFLAKDGATAKEMQASSGGKVTFGRNKMKLMAKVSETVLRSTALNIDGAVTSGLQSAQAAKELKVLFATVPTAGEEKMSLYSAQTGIKEVQGATMLDAIMAAYGDLEDLYVPNACVVMRRIDYIAMIKQMANSESLFGKKPEEIIGVPVVFCAQAVQPVVGDFRFLHMNFDMAPLYDTDKDVTTGNHLFVLTHWYDIKVKMASAFRRAKVKTA